MKDKHNPMHYMNMINEYLDNALSEEKCTDFIRSVQSNPALNKMLNNERLLRNMIKNRIERKKVGDELINTIKQKLY
jgi:hypothetical protein